MQRLVLLVSCCVCINSCSSSRSAIAVPCSSTLKQMNKIYFCLVVVNLYDHCITHLKSRIIVAGFEIIFLSRWLMTNFFKAIFFCQGYFLHKRNEFLVIFKSNNYYFCWGQKVSLRSEWFPWNTFSFIAFYWLHKWAVSHNFEPWVDHV